MSDVLHAPAAGSIRFRSVLILLAVIAAIAAGYGQMALDIGQTPREFAADSDATLRVATWAFSIWGLIYAWLVVYAVWQALPKSPQTRFVRALAWSSALASLGIGAWIFASAFDQELLTIVLIVGSTLVLIAPLSGFNARKLTGREYWMAATPLGLLAGWLTIASAANILTVLTGNGDLPAMLSPTGWAIAAVAVVALIAVLVLLKTRLFAYAVPIVWGLAAICDAEQARNGTLALTALGLALGLAGLALYACFFPRSRA